MLCLFDLWHQKLFFRACDVRCVSCVIGTSWHSHAEHRADLYAILAARYCAQVFPHGTKWADPAHCGEKLHAKAKEAIIKEGNVSASITEDTLSVLDKATVEALAARCAAVLVSELNALTPSKHFCRPEDWWLLVGCAVAPGAPGAPGVAGVAGATPSVCC